ncbi:cytochrome c oxidase subunit 3 family protein [Agrobacterium vitis]|uniref:cytochrome c oxidase subunit 3 n=1 Tax=Rhizobium/Agrobacterium group TaxID=227290 RepID=UPI0012E77E39|nr:MULTISPECIES: cytochrome c oxidase subunit 3 [Rhizobium/Agrobacterium group]MCF1494485.1 cytochrome c oxidase subunit 3 family protein [Allorhizobium ampelinum]MVA45991.1 cytochrome c oxidase subunit 3 family protein [Agrobacterium vitis]
MAETARFSREAAGEGPDAGNLLLWILVWSELAAFGALLSAFLINGYLQPDAFAVARQHLNVPLAAINTLVLITSGWQAALAVRTGATPGQQRRALLLAAVFGLLFCGIKLYEYAGEIGFAGQVQLSGFFELYFLITGFHLMHVAFGALVLIVVAWRLSRENIILITTLWHVFDLIWILMFPIVYLA